MAAITHPRLDGIDEAPSPARGAGARAAAVRSRGAVRGARPALFVGNGQVRRAAPPVRFTSVPLVAHDDLAPRAHHRRPSTVRLVGTATTTSRATYRRRRLVVAALLLGALLTGSWVLGALGGGSLAASEGRSSTTARDALVLEVQPVSRSTYVVAPGDTLWSIARALQPEGDVRPVVDALAAARQGRPLEVGETIVLP